MSGTTLIRLDDLDERVPVQAATGLGTWTFAECATTGLLLLFLTHFYIPILEPVQNSLFAASSEEQTSAGQVIQAGIWLLCSAMMLKRLSLVISGLRKIGWTSAFVFLTLLSAAWSQEPTITIRKSVFLILTTAFGAYFAKQYSVDRQLRMICVAACVISVLSISFALLLPRYGLDHDAHEGVWVGVFTQKNVCAREMLFLLACLLAYAPDGQKMRWLRGAALLGVLTVIAGTQSKTAFLMTALVLAFFPALRLIRRLSSGLAVVLVSAGLAILGLACVIAASAMPRLMLLLGRDGTMTGRTEIWQAVMEAIMKRPLLGYGFAAFWLSLKGESANIVLTLRWAVPAAHNGFLDIWLQVGAFGLALFAIGFYKAGKPALRDWRQPSFQQAAWPLSVLLLTIVYNLDESSLMQANDFLWVLYVATLVNLASTERLHRIGYPVPVLPMLVHSRDPVS